MPPLDKWANHHVNKILFVITKKIESKDLLNKTAVSWSRDIYRVPAHKTTFAASK
jgi:hypothetical protein